jgi:hypothetical protein
MNQGRSIVRFRLSLNNIQEKCQNRQENVCKILFKSFFQGDSSWVLGQLSPGTIVCTTACESASEVHITGNDRFLAKTVFIS